MKNKLVLPVTILVAACIALAVWLTLPKPTVVGEWTITGSGFGQGVNAEVVFSEDGTFTMTTVGNTKDLSMVPSEQKEMVFETVMEGTWEVKDEKLHIMFNDQAMKIDGQRIARTTPQQGLEKQNILNTLNSYSPYTLKWNGADEFTTSAKDQTRIYNRKD